MSISLDVTMDLPRSSACAEGFPALPYPISEVLQMADFIKLNGTAVRTTGLYQRSIPQADGPSLDEVELVIIVRGSMANRSLKQLLSTEIIHVDLPVGAKTVSFDSTIENVQVGSSGAGEAAAYRFDLTLRETPQSAALRASEPAEHVDEAPKAAGPSKYAQAEMVDENPNAPLDLSQIKVSSDSAVWATALKQLTTPKNLPPSAFLEPPLSALEQACVDAKLMNLRMEALIDQLEAAGRVRRIDVDISYLQLVAERFANEVTPLVGEKVAKRVEREVLQ
jgi:hypothetical protein